MTRDYPSDWQSRRKKVYKRDNYQCQNCGNRGGPKGGAELHAHHIVPKSKGGTHKISNLKTLCKKCHDAIHTNKSAPTAKYSSEQITHSNSSNPRGKSPSKTNNNVGRSRKKPQISDLRKIPCPECGQDSLTQQRPRIVDCQACSAKFKSMSGDWRKIYGDDEMVGVETSVEGWSGIFEHRFGEEIDLEQGSRENIMQSLLWWK